MQIPKMYLKGFSRNVRKQFNFFIGFWKIALKEVELYLNTGLAIYETRIKIIVNFKFIQITEGETVILPPIIIGRPDVPEDSKDECIYTCRLERDRSNHL